MMKTICCSGLLLAVLALAFPQPAEAQFCRGLFGNCCRTCAAPPNWCTCTALQPTIETGYRQENVVTYQDVTRIGLRQEAQVETVPVTTFDQVTVDEGHYQMVWVPKPVTKTVAKTTLQPRLGYRSVPYAYTERVPQVATRLVPQQTVRYTAQQTHVVLNGIPRTTVMGAPLAIQPIVPILSSAPPQSSVPATAGTEAWRTSAALGAPEFATPEAPSSGSGVELQSPVVPDPLPDPGFDESVKAPSAARVWQSSQRTIPARW